MTSKIVQIYGVLGYPVKQSLSPLMHNAAFKHFKINAQYKLFTVRPKQLSVFLKSLRKQNIYGLNVTIPYKEKVIPFLHRISPEARLIKAVNTIRVIKNKLYGFNTDGAGFLQHLKKDLKFNPRNKRVALMGAGGAARAVAVYLAKAGCRAINIYDLEKDKAFRLTTWLQRNFKNTEFKAVSSICGLKVQKSDLLVNATPVGMKKGDPCLIGKESLGKKLLVYDLIYRPVQTQLLKMAKAKGAKVSNGLGMLLNQGMLSFFIWTGKKPPKRIMQHALGARSPNG